MPENLNEDQRIVLGMFLASSTGLTEEEFVRKATENWVAEPMKIFGQLVSKGLVRKQSRKNEGRPDMLKATTDAFYID